MITVEQYTIPRNIKVREGLIHGLNGKQVIYIGVGLGLSLAVCATGLPIDVKIAASAISVSGGLLLSMKKIHGQEIDKYIVNSVKYPLRRKEFGGEDNEKTVVCHLRYVL